METDQDSQPVTYQEATCNSLPNIAHLLASISTNLDLQTFTLPALLSLLEQLAGQSFTQEHADLTKAVTSSMCRVVEKTVETLEGVSLVHETVVSRVLLLCIGPSLISPLPTRHLLTEDAILGNCLTLLKIFTLAASNDHR